MPIDVGQRADADRDSFAAPIVYDPQVMQSLGRKQLRNRSVRQSRCRLQTNLDEFAKRFFRAQIGDRLQRRRRVRFEKVRDRIEQRREELVLRHRQRAQIRAGKVANERVCEKTSSLAPVEQTSEYATFLVEHREPGCASGSEHAQHLQHRLLRLDV